MELTKYIKDCLKDNEFKKYWLEDNLPLIESDMDISTREEQSTIEEAIKELNDEISYDKSLYGEEEELREDLLLEMANLVGRRVKIEDIPFSIYFSRKNASRHSIRVKVFWDKNEINEDRCGYIELHGDYIYSQSPSQKYKPKSYQIDTLRYFVKRYKILFSAVWEGVLGEDSLQEYFKGSLSFKDLLKEFNGAKIGKQKYEAINYAEDLKQLEKIVRQYNVFNMND